jgi:hypothetical protein
VKSVAEVYGVLVEGYGGAVVQACGGGVTMVIRTRNSKGTDTKTSTQHADADTNSTMQTEKTMQRIGWFMGRDDLNPNCIFGFFVVYRYEHRCNLNYENSKSHRAT